ncbi:2481_t:CDS:2, partial [Acaulospora morrowiae]
MAPEKWEFKSKELYKPTNSREFGSSYRNVYVDLQKQLVALEAHLRRENREAQERFNATLPENTPAVIPEIIEMTSEHNSQLSNSSNTIDKIDLSSTEDVGISASAPKPQKSIYTRTNTKKTRLIKSIIKKTTKKITSRLINSPDKNADKSQPLPTSHFDRDFQSLRVEPSIPPSSTRSTARSKTSSKKPKPPPKGIFVPTHDKANSTDTINTMSAQQASPRLSINNSIKNNYPHSPLYTSSAPGSPITTLP